jgi:DNA-binding transcriptional ArsR family regulator
MSSGDPSLHYQLISLENGAKLSRVRMPAPPLLPVFRSRLVGDMLALVLAHPDRSWTLEDLANRVQAPYQTVTAEIRRLEEAELVTTRSVGRSKLVTANADHPYVRPLTELVLMAFGPPMVVAEEFAKVPGIEDLWIYGSWAARHAGVSGRPPADVDVLVVGDVDRDAVYQAARRAEHRLGREVNATIRTTRSWKRADDAFATTVKESPMLALPGPWAA